VTGWSRRQAHALSLAKLAGEPVSAASVVPASIASVAAVADLKLHSSGKVREIYAWEDDLLMVASDRISIYDVVMPTPIPDKGKVLNRISEFWFELTADIVPNHFVSADVPEEVAERAMRVRRLEMYPVECVVRGYLSGSGWKEYERGGAVCGIELPAGLRESEKLPEPIFTPATKAEIGDHDENVDFERAAEIVGDRALMEELRRISIDVYARGAEHAAARGIVLADTKFEFGRHPGAEVVLADEVLTPDSSRFWPADRYEPGRTQPSFDKQYVRDWATQAGWDKQPPAPELPADVVEQTRSKYVEAYERLAERSF
jgi:phosphoribosylaminoimidazole-succinocarboxamide synthase